MLKDYPYDWCALLKEVPASPVGSKEGANYICIGRYSSEFYITFLKENKMFHIKPSGFQIV